MSDKQDWFDRGVNVVQLIVTGLIGWLAYQISVSQDTSAKNQASAARASQQYEVITGLLAKCSPVDATTASYLLNLHNLINDKTIDATQFSPDQIAQTQFNAAMTFCWTQVTMAINQTSSTKSTPPLSPSTALHASKADNGTASNWVYLGTYKGGKWQTHYFDNYQGFDPSANRGQNPREIDISPDFHVNIRFGTLDDTTAQYPSSPCTVSGKKIKIIQEIQWWSNSNNYWGRIDPGENPCKA